MGDSGQLDLFTITAIDPPWRDNRDTMGYPFLSLQNGRKAPILYEDENVWLKVSASAEHGIASIWDWDVIIFASSHLNEAIESGRKVSPRIEFPPYNCLKQIGRHTGGGNYQELAQAIRRLEATLVVTDIRLADQPDRSYESPFRWLKNYGFPKKRPRHYTTPDGITHITPRDSTGEADPTQPWMIELHPWLFNAIVRQGDILAVHPDYFQLRGGIERWLYRLARKAVPDKAEKPVICFKLDKLHARSGVTAPLRNFAIAIRKLAETQPLPEYGISIEYRKGQRELVTLYRDKAKPARPSRGRRLKTIRGEHVEPVVTTDTYLDEEPPLVIVPEALIEPIEREEPPLAAEPDSPPATTPRPTIAVEQPRETTVPLDEPAPESVPPLKELPVDRLVGRFKENATILTELLKLAATSTEQELLGLENFVKALAEELEPVCQANWSFEDAPERLDELRQWMEQAHEKARALEKNLGELRLRISADQSEWSRVTLSGVARRRAP